MDTCKLFRAYFAFGSLKLIFSREYRACSYFPRIYGQVTAAETYEGENTVLWLQVARYSLFIHLQLLLIDSIVFFFFFWLRYLVKTRREKSGGVSVSYLIREDHGPKKVDPSPEGLVQLFRRVATGYAECAFFVH